MAANKVTGLLDVIEAAKAGREYIIGQLDAALNFSTWTEDLDPDVGRAFRAAWDARDLGEILCIAEREYPKASAECAELGYPATREEWHRAKYG